MVYSGNKTCYDTNNKTYIHTGSVKQMIALFIMCDTLSISSCSESIQLCQSDVCAILCRVYFSCPG